jgi:cystathionine beta-synthase
MPSIALNTSDELRVYDNILETIGNTPLVRFNRVGRSAPCPIYAKIEYLNPGGSVKDRIGLTMIREAEVSGRLQPGGTVVEATSGNTGVGIAIACAIKGYKAIFVMPDHTTASQIVSLRKHQMPSWPTNIIIPRTQKAITKLLVQRYGSKPKDW